MLKRFGGHQIFNSIANSRSLLTRSKALVRSIKAIKKSRFCSLHFSCSCSTEKNIPVVQRLDINPHWIPDILFQPVFVVDEELHVQNIHTVK